MTQSVPPQTGPRSLSDSDLAEVQGGLLVPAVQAAREAARRQPPAK